MHCGQIVDPSISKDGKTHCNQVWEIHTDPKSCDYKLVSGLRRPEGNSDVRASNDVHQSLNELFGDVGSRGNQDRRRKRSEFIDIDGRTQESDVGLEQLYLDVDVTRKMKEDPMFRLEVLARREQVQLQQATKVLIEAEEAQEELLRLESAQGSSSSSSKREIATESRPDEFDESPEEFDLTASATRAKKPDDQVGNLTASSSSQRITGRIGAAKESAKRVDNFIKEEEAKRDAQDKDTTYLLLNPAEKRKVNDHRLRSLIKQTNQRHLRDFDVNASLRARHREERRADKVKEALALEDEKLGGAAKKRILNSEAALALEDDKDAIAAFNADPANQFPISQLGGSLTLNPINNTSSSSSSTGPTTMVSSSKFVGARPKKVTGSRADAALLFDQQLKRRNLMTESIFANCSSKKVAKPFDKSSKQKPLQSNSGLSRVGGSSSSRNVNLVSVANLNLASSRNKKKSAGMQSLEEKAALFHQCQSLAKKR